MKQYDIYNPTQVAHIVYDGTQSYRVRPGDRLQRLPLSDDAVALLVNSDTPLQIMPRGDHVLPTAKPKPAPVAVTTKPKLIVDGMYGIGDNLHQRAAIRELLKTYEVWLITCHAAIWHDMVGRGLHLHRKHTKLRTQAKILQREVETFPDEPLPDGVQRIKIWYSKEAIDKHGTIAGALMAECGVEDRPIDFSMPVPRSWRNEAKKLIAEWKPTKPLMIYRPIVRRKEWNGENRNPDPVAYAEIFKSIRDRYFVVSIADLKADEEWIVGEEQDADIKIHDGSLHFETLAGLFAEADLVFCNAGMAPVVAQAVGTPSIVVYGGRECFRTTQAAGAHLAPTLGIDPITPCDCQKEGHNCDKRIDVEEAKKSAFDFTQVAKKDRTLIFGTVYVDSPERDKLTRQWMKLHSELNPECDLLLVDSNSPIKGWRDDCVAYGVHVHDFGDNIGHLSRRGRDGWGRAFCYGLEWGVDQGYDYVAHVEGDSLLRTPVVQITRRMHQESKGVASIPVKGMKGAKDYPTWIETGLMAFSADWLVENDFTRKYDWPNRQESPTPEIIVRQLVENNLLLLDLKGERGDKNQITASNVGELDWVTHCHVDTQVYDRFVEVCLERRINKVVKINLGCGENKLDGWENHDADVDISRPLPYPDGHADFIFCEHCVEHIPYVDAVAFFKECHRVLKPGGVLRITVPSIEQIYRRSGPDYWRFATKFGNENSLRGAMNNIMFKHGHQTCWTASLLDATLFYAGFDNPVQRAVHSSTHPELNNVEGHHHIIGEEFNTLESICFEGTKEQSPAAIMHQRVAVVCGGGPTAYPEISEAVRLYGDRCDFFYVNDMIYLMRAPGVGITLHPEKLEGWVKKRGTKSRLKEIWSHKDKPGVTNVTDDWGGSSGLFAVKVALEKGYGKIVLCGVPMTTGNHLVRGEPWDEAPKYLKKWQRHIDELKPYVRSFSGWTAETFGRPE